MNKYLILATVILMGSTFACREPKKILTERERQLISDSVLPGVPVGEEIVSVNAVFDDQVELLGYSLKPKPLKQDQASSLVLYWRAREQISGDYKIFVHVDSIKGKRNSFDHYPVNGLYPFSSWTPSEIVKDEVSIKLDEGFPEGTAYIYLGIYDVKDMNKGDRRMKISKAGLRWAADKERLVLSAVTVGAPVPPIQVRRAVEPLTIDGRLDEPSWNPAFSSRSRMMTPDGKSLPDDLPSDVGLLWDETYLYVAFKVADKDIASAYTDVGKRDQTLWSTRPRVFSDNVEIYLDVDADSRDYLELQIAPTGAVFDAKFDFHRSPKWEKAAEAFTIDMKQAVSIDGTLNQKDTDNGYTVEVAIPWAQIPGLTGVPEDGRVITANFYRLSETGSQSAALVPVGNGDYHVLDVAAELKIVK